MTNSDKAIVYDNCIRENETLAREISSLKSEFSVNPPPHVAKIIAETEAKMKKVQARLESLF